MNTKKQQLLIEYLISSVDTFALCSAIVRPEYFDPELRNAVSFIKKYYEQYNTVPSEDQVSSETGVDLTLRTVTKDKIDYCANEIETFCRTQAVIKAVLASPPLIENGEIETVRQMVIDAAMVSLNRDLGLRYFEDPLNRLRMLNNSEAPQPTGWDEFDELLNGGIVKKQMTLFSANSGGGKSIVMANLGLNLMERGLGVLYISLELSEAMVSLRYDSMIAGTCQAEWRQRVTETATKIEAKRSSLGDLFIKYMPAGSNSSQICSYLKEFELQFGFTPDVLIVDYLDIMGTNSHVSGDNVFEKDKQAAEQLRNIAGEYNMHVITASQQNRGAVGQTDLNHSHIAGGISKINTTDVYVSIIMSSTMRAAGEVAFQFLKTRSSDGVGKTMQLKWDSKTLRITNPDDTKRFATSGNRKEERQTRVDEEDSFQSPSGEGLLSLLSATSSSKF